MVTVTRLYERRQVEILIPALSSPQQPPNSPLLGVFLTTGFFKGLSNYWIFKGLSNYWIFKGLSNYWIFKGLSNYWIFEGLSKYWILKGLLITGFLTTMQAACI